MVICIDHPQTYNGKYAPYVDGCVPQGLYLNIKGLLFISSQGSHFALVWYGDRYRVPKNGLCPKMQFLNNFYYNKDNRIWYFNLLKR